MVASSKISLIIGLALGCTPVFGMAVDLKQPAVARSNANAHLAEAYTHQRRQETFNNTDSALPEDKQPDQADLKVDVVQGGPISASDLAALEAEAAKDKGSSSSKKIRRLDSKNAPRDLVGAFQETSVGDFFNNCVKKSTVLGPFNMITMQGGVGNDDLSGQPMIASITVVDFNGNKSTLGSGAPSGDPVTLTLGTNEYFSSGNFATINNDQTPSKVSFTTNQGHSISSAAFSDGDYQTTIVTGSGVMAELYVCADQYGNLNSIRFGFIDTINSLVATDIKYLDPTGSNGALLGSGANITPASSGIISVGRFVSDNQNFSLPTTVGITTSEAVVTTSSLETSSVFGIDDAVEVKISGGVQIPFIESSQAEASASVKITIGETTTVQTTSTTESSIKMEYQISCPAGSLCVFEAQYPTFTRKFDCIVTYKATVGNGASFQWTQPGIYSITDTPGLRVTNTEYTAGKSGSR